MPPLTPLSRTDLLALGSQIQWANERLTRVLNESPAQWETETLKDLLNQGASVTEGQRHLAEVLRDALADGALLEQAVLLYRAAEEEESFQDEPSDTFLNAALMGNRLDAWSWGLSAGMMPTGTSLLLATTSGKDDWVDRVLAEGVSWADTAEHFAHPAFHWDSLGHGGGSLVRHAMFPLVEQGRLRHEDALVALAQTPHALTLMHRAGFSLEGDLGKGRGLVGHLLSRLNQYSRLPHEREAPAACITWVLDHVSQPPVITGHNEHFLEEALRLRPKLPADALAQWVPRWRPEWPLPRPFRASDALALSDAGMDMDWPQRSAHWLESMTMRHAEWTPPNFNEADEPQAWAALVARGLDLDAPVQGQSQWQHALAYIPRLTQPSTGVFAWMRWLLGQGIGSRDDLLALSPLMEERRRKVPQLYEGYAELVNDHQAWAHWQEQQLQRQLSAVDALASPRRPRL